MNVAPVSDIDLANARMKAAINDGLMMGNVTVLDAVNGGAPRVLEAFFKFPLIIQQCPNDDSHDDWI